MRSLSYETNRNKFKNNYIIQIIIAVLFIFSNYSVWSKIGPIPAIIRYLYILPMVLILYLCIKKLNSRENIKIIIFLTLYIMLCCIGILIHPETKNSIISSYILGFISAFIYAVYCKKSYKENNRYDILVIMADMIYYYSIIALIMYLVFTVLHLVSPQNTIILFKSNIIYQSYYNVFFVSQGLVFKSSVFIRNGAVFFEPGVYSLYLVYSLLIYFFYSNKKNMLKIVLLLISILTTLSTTGIILSLMFICIKFITHNFKNRNLKLIKISSIPLFIVCFAVLVYKVYFEKTTSYGISSYLIRNDDLVSGLILFKQKFLFGWGIDNIDILRSVQNLSIRESGASSNSNGIVTILYQGGIYLAAAYIIPMIFLLKYYWKEEKRKLFAIMLMLYLLFELYSYPFQNSLFMFLFLSIGYTSKILDSKAMNSEE